MIGRDQAKINTMIVPLKSKPGGCAVQMAIDQYGMGNPFLLVLMGMTTGVGGGMLRDVLIDAMTGLDIPARQHPLIHGDALSYSIACASIIAKVVRDRYMVEQDALYPMYGFARNMGYGTAEHIAALKEYGPCPLHRRSFIGHFV